MTVTNPPGTYREVEIKLDADADFVLPDLGALPGISSVQDAEVQDLEAVYLDSSDLRLARHGTTFRRRTGGTDEGWHLKLPTAGKARIEVRRAPGRSVRAVPPKLLGLVRVQLRGLPVEPVARISTRRTVRRLLDADGVVLAEVADDEVTAEALGEELSTTKWREIEVELVEGDDALLASASEALISAGARSSDSRSKLRRALAHRLSQLGLPDLAEAAVQAKDAAAVRSAGDATDSAGAGGGKKFGKKGRRAGAEPAPPAVPTAGEVAVQFLTVQVGALIAEDPQVRINAEDGVHQMRVACRRLRTALATFRPLFTEQAGESLRDELKWLAGLLGVARDAEVMRARLKQEIAEQPGELVLGPVLRRIDLEIGQAYRDGHTAVIAALDGDRYLALVAALEAFISQPPLSERAGRPAPAELRTAVRKACRRVRTAAAGLDAAGSMGSPDLAGSADVAGSAGSAGSADSAGSRSGSAGSGSAGAAGSAGSAAQDALDQHLHEVRIAAKRARYAAEAVLPVIGRPAKAVAKAMEQVQETLGDHQDAVVERAWLRDLAVRAFLAGENSFTFGRLHGLADARASHDQELFASVWARTQQVIAVWPG